MKKADGWRRVTGGRLSRRRLLRDAAGIGIGLATLAPMGCEDQRQATPTREVPAPRVSEMPPMALPVPSLWGRLSLEEAISNRRSRREFKDSALTLEQISQILWAAQGITGARELRAAPSAGALYPLDLYLAVGRQGVQGLGEGAYHYMPQSHALQRILEEDVRESVARLSSGQMFVAQAPVILIITGEYERTTRKYGDRGLRYVHMEAGHAAQDVYLQVEALGLGTVSVGAFRDEELSQTLALPTKHQPLYVMPVGHPVPA